MTLDKQLMHEAEALALADYEAVAGRIIEAGWVMGYDEHDNSAEAAGPFLVRVDRRDLNSPTLRDDLMHWNDEFLDPYWDCTPVEDYPELKGIRSFWTHGRTYAIRDGKIIPDQEIKPLPRWEGVKLRLKTVLHKVRP
jgi:hypothetical protein